MAVFQNWQQRHTVVGLTFSAVFICYIDRVNISVAIIPMAQELGWSLETRGAVLSSFFLGYLLLQIVGGRLADRFGGKAVLGAGVLIWSLFTVLTPPAAWVGLTALLCVRVMMGMGEAVTFPSIYSLYGRWIPLKERSRAIALANSGIPLGTVFGLLVTPIIVEVWGWEWAFYLFGILGIFWYAAWQPKVSSVPERAPRVSAQELELIQAGTNVDESAEAPTLREFLKSLPVWAIIVAHFCNNWSLYVLLSWMPTFVTEGLGVDFAAVGFFAMIPSVASFVFLNFAGQVADRLIRDGMPVIRVRRLMQSIGCVGIALALLVVGHVGSAWLAISIMALGNAVGAFVTGGFASNHMDIAPRHAGTLMGITNTAGTIPGFLGVYVSGLILEATGSWALVFQVTAAITLFGWIFYLLFARAEKLFD